MSQWVFDILGGKISALRFDEQALHKWKHGRLEENPWVENFCYPMEEKKAKNKTIIKYIKECNSE